MDHNMNMGYNNTCPMMHMHENMMPMHSNNIMAPSNELLDLIVEAMKAERHDRVKYNNMMDMTKNSKVKKQINFAFEDEGKHYKMFQRIYYMLTGKKIDIPIPPVEKYDKLIDAIETSIDGELEAVELYRKIKSMLGARQLRDMLYEIITDEQEHATRFVYLYAMEKDR